MPVRMSCHNSHLVNVLLDGRATVTRGRLFRVGTRSYGICAELADVVRPFPRLHRTAIGQVYNRVTPATMRHLFICTLLCVLPIPALAQTTFDWANRLTANDPEVPAMAAADL